MRNQADYLLKLTAAPDETVAERAYDRAWRFDFSAPGFSLLDAGPVVDSHTLRAWMVSLKRLLSEIAQRRTGRPFFFRSMAHFDQQETTKFHLDGAPDQSMLLLGYEPSQVQSRLFLGDYTRAAFDLGVTPQQFLQDYNPMFRKGEEILAPYASELPQPEPGHARILLINNSSLAFTEARTNPLGVMHKAIIVTPDESKRRIVNSTMLVLEGEEIGIEKQEEFVATTRSATRTIEARPMNRLTIYPYLLGSTWVFDDPRTGLKEEAFVLGMTEMISRLVEVKGMRQAAKGFTLHFSPEPFEGADAELNWLRGGDSEVLPGKDGSASQVFGNWYKSTVAGEEMEGWLCPALGLYFKAAPARIFVKAEPLPAGVDPIWHIDRDAHQAVRFVSAPTEG